MADFESRGGSGGDSPGTGGIEILSFLSIEELMSRTELGGEEGVVLEILIRCVGGDVGGGYGEGEVACLSFTGFSTVDCLFGLGFRGGGAGLVLLPPPMALVQAVV